MEVKRNFTSGILLIIATIMTTTDCANKKGDPSKLSFAKDSIMSFLSMSPSAFKNWKTSSVARHFNKAVGLAPIVNENNFKSLMALLSNEADLIKIGAFRKLNKMSDSATTEEDKKKYILAKLQGTVELIKYYGVAWNCPMVKFTFIQGLYYAYSCVKLHTDNPGQCLKKKMQLYTAFIFGYKIDVNRVTRFFLNKTTKEAEKYLSKDDRTLKFIDAKIACEVKFAQDNKNLFLKSAMKLFMGSSRKDKNYNCVNELMPFEGHLKEIDSYPGEYHYLIARAYGYQKNYPLALDHLRKARKAEVVDSKTRETNKKVQAYYEKIYTRMNANAK